MLMRIEITQKQGEPYMLEWTNRAQKGTQDDFLQDKIKALVARMAAINTLIIECEGSNEFYS